MKTLPLVAAVSCSSLDYMIDCQLTAEVVDESQRRHACTFNYIAAFPRGGADDSESDNHSAEKASKSKRPKSSRSKKGNRKRDTSPFGNSGKSDDTPDNDDNGTTNNVVLDDILKHDDFYQVLGVPRTAEKIEIKKAYRRRAVHTHPDKTGGDRRAFDKVSQAYEVLSDETKRQLYNRFGKDGPDGERPAANGSAYQDLFRSMFRQEMEANRSARYQLEVSLEDLYNGKSHDIDIGSPYSRDAGKSVQVHIPRGSSSGQRIVLSGEIDFAASDTPGDLVFILSQKPHPVFTRKGVDLAMELTISLEEALCGFCKKIRHLNGTDIWVMSAQKDEKPVIIQTGDVQSLLGYGMPKHSSGDDFGDLFIQFRIEMPKQTNHNLSGKELQELSRLLKKLGGQSKTHVEIDHTGNTKPSVLRVASAKDFGKESQNFDFDDHAYEGGDIRSFSSGFFDDAGPSRGMFWFGGRRGFNEDDTGDAQCQHM